MAKHTVFYAEWARQYKAGISTNAIAEKYGCDHKNVLYALKRLGVDRRSKTEHLRRYNLNEHYFDEITTDEQAYWLGFIAADGCVFVKPPHYMLRIELQAKDGQHLKRFLRALDSNYPILTRIRKSDGREYHSIFISSEPLIRALINLGIGPKKTFTVAYPEMVSSKLSYAFIRGLFDGDGSISKKTRWKITGSFPMITRVAEIIAQQANLPREAICKTKNSYCFAYYSRGNIRTIRDWLYTNATVWLSRKRELMEVV